MAAASSLFLSQSIGSFYEQSRLVAFTNEYHRLLISSVVEFLFSKFNSTETKITIPVYYQITLWMKNIC